MEIKRTLVMNVIDLFREMRICWSILKWIWIKGPLLDFSTLEKMNKDWVSETNSNEDKLKLPKYQNQKHMPLIEPQNKQEKVLKKLPPGGLHCKIKKLKLVELILFHKTSAPKLKSSLLNRCYI